MSPLPKELPHQYHHLSYFSKLRTAYATCLRVELSLSQTQESGQDVTKELIYIRVLGFLIHHSPSDKGLETVESDINSCTTDDQVLSLGELYFNSFVRAFKSSRGHTRTPSKYSSRPSFNALADMINDTLDEPPRSHAEAKKCAFIRDGFRCCITGRYDGKSVMKNKELRRQLDEEASTIPTQCAHIFSKSLNTDIVPGGPKRNDVFSMWSILSRFGYTSLPDELNGDGIHRLENVMTLEVNFHVLFDELAVWLEKTGEPNLYKLEALHPLIIKKYPKYVEFTSTDPKFLLPSSDYLSIHAACAKVAHFSGAAEHIEKLCQDMEDIKVLNTDGSSFDILEQALFQNLHVFESTFKVER